MRFHLDPGRGVTLLALHPVFALTGAADAITGPLLPSLAHSFALTDSQSGVLLSAVFAGTAVGALLCRGNYARVLTLGLLGLACSCTCFVWMTRPLLYPCAFFFGVGTGAAMTAVSLFTGRNYPERRAATLTLLNFTWSLGAMLAPLLAARLMAYASWRAVYAALAVAAALAALAMGFTLRDSEEAVRPTPETSGLHNLRLVALFALFFFMEVGMESTFGAWISTYVLRTVHTTVELAAAAAAIYWAGFLAVRGLSPLVLSHVSSWRLLRISLLWVLGAAVLLVASASPLLLVVAIVLAGAAIAPIFPVALAAFFDRARHSSDTRFILALSGFGGAFFSWLVGALSARTGSLREGLLVAPATLLAMFALLPLLGTRAGSAADAT
ncbi:MAG: MFS transporter [Terracidiphilus sp.]